MSRSLWRAVLVVLCLVGMAQPGHAAGVVFRYLPGNAALSSAVVAEGLEAGPYLDPQWLYARSAGGWGLAPPHTAEFEAPGTTLRSAATDAVSQPLGPRLTVEAWVRPTDVAGRRVLLTNQVGGTDGFTLGLEAGRPFFVLQIGGQAYRLTAATTLAAGRNHWLAATASQSAGTLTLALYHDGHRLAETAVAVDVPSPYRIARPFYVGTEATGDAAAPALAGSFSGHLFGAIVRDYVAAEAYLASPVPHDDGAYFGLPDFHDYALTTFHLPMDQRISASPTPVRHRFFLPFVNDEFVPQGTATRVEEEGGQTVPLVYVAYYHRTRSGATETRASIVAEIDVATGHLRRAFRLMGRLSHSHAGGIAYSHGALFVSSVGVLERYPLPPYEGPGGDKYLDLAADESGTINVESKASFVSAHQDTLWVGDWRTASDVAPYLYAYPLGGDGRPMRGARPAVYALPRNIQGVDLFTHKGVTYVFLSRNRNGREAEVLRLRRSALDPYTVPRADTSITLPFGIEDLSFFPDGTLWTNSESGTVYYQHTASWTTFYPFVYSVPPSAILPGVSPLGRDDAGPDGRGFGLDAYPNPFRDSASVTLTLSAPGLLRVSVVDLLGRTVAVLADGMEAAGAHALRWEAEDHPAGLYFIVAEHGQRRVVRALSRVR